MIERIIRMWRGNTEPIPDDIDTAFPSLVLLVNGEIPASKPFLQGAIEHVFGVTLDVDKDDSEQFLTGQFPIFIYRMNGRLVQLKFMPESYFSKTSAKIAPANPAFVQSRIDTKPLRAAVANHVMWVEASAM